MPRPTKLFLKLTKELPIKLLESTTDESKEKLKVFSQLLEQFSRTRHSDRKKKYKNQLTTVFQRLCLELDDSKREVVGCEKEVDSLDKKLKQKQRAVEKAQEREVRTQCKLDKALDWERLYHEQQKTNRVQSSHFSSLLRENTVLEGKLETARKRVKKLQEKKELK